MTDDQYYAKEWLNRMYNLSLWIESLEKKREARQWLREHGCDDDPWHDKEDNA